MAIESIGSTPSSTSALNNAGLGQDDFIKILLAQLSFQDPLKPLDNQEFIAQMAQFTNLEVSNQQNEKIDTLLTIQSASQAVGLIGKTVEVTTDTGSQVGTVMTVRFENGTPLMNVQPDGGADPIRDVTLSRIFLVR